MKKYKTEFSGKINYAICNTVRMHENMMTPSRYSIQ